MTAHVESWLQKSQRRLLVVANQVATCQALGRQIQELIEKLSPETRLIIYHSRFKLVDRRQRHEEVIREFKDSTQRVVLVSTQVCQMSLDLDAESLFSELAPLPDLIQRMGRVNRHGRYTRGKVVIFPSTKEKPYERTDLDEADRLLRTLPKLAATSQLDLAQLMDEAGNREEADQQTVALFDCIPKLESQPYRDIQEFAVDSLLNEDEDKFLELQEARCAKRAGLIVPVPRFEAKKNANSKLPRYLRIAEAKNYSPIFGYEVKQ